VYTICVRCCGASCSIERLHSTPTTTTVATTTAAPITTATAVAAAAVTTAAVATATITTASTPNVSSHVREAAATVAIGKPFQRFDEDDEAFGVDVAVHARWLLSAHANAAPDRRDDTEVQEEPRGNGSHGLCLVC
jgi:hypothetical protein